MSGQQEFECLKSRSNGETVLAWSEERHEYVRVTSLLMTRQVFLLDAVWACDSCQSLSVRNVVDTVFEGVHRGNRCDCADLKPHSRENRSAGPLSGAASIARK